MESSRQVTIVILIVLILGLGAAALYFALDLGGGDTTTPPTGTTTGDTTTGGTTGDLPAQDALAAGESCNPSSDLCGEGLFCLGDTATSGVCKEEVVGGRSCTTLVAFRCITPDEWTPAGAYVAGSTGGESACTERPQQVNTWQEGLDYIDGCGQVDLIWDDELQNALNGEGAMCDQSFKARRETCAQDTTVGAQVYCVNDNNQQIPLPGVTLQYTINTGDTSAVQTLTDSTDSSGNSAVTGEYQDATWAIEISNFPDSSLVPGTQIPYSDLTLNDTNCEECESSNPYISQASFPACTTSAGPAGFTGEFGNCPIAAGSTATSAEFVFSGCDAAPTPTPTPTPTPAPTPLPDTSLGDTHSILLLAILSILTGVMIYKTRVIDLIANLNFKSKVGSKRKLKDKMIKKEKDIEREIYK